MYITLQSPKRKLGLFDLEFKDIVLGGIFAILFTVFFILELYQTGLVFLLSGIFLLVPVSFSGQNRMYKLVILVTNFIFRNKNFYYHKVRRDQHNKIIEKN